MGTEETVTETPHEVIEAVKEKARQFRAGYKTWTKLASDAMANASESYDEAAALRAKAEACEQWLDERAPDWRDEDPAPVKDDRPPRDFAEEPIG